MRSTDAEMRRCLIGDMPVVMRAAGGEAIERYAAAGVYIERAARHYATMPRQSSVVVAVTRVVADITLMMTPTEIKRYATSAVDATAYGAAMLLTMPPYDAAAMLMIIAASLITRAIFSATRAPLMPRRRRCRFHLRRHYFFFFTLDFLLFDISLR